MRKAKTTQKVQWPAPDVVTKVIPSPTDGWDAITPLAEMDPKRAPILDNWIPRPGYVELRSGYLLYSKPTTSPIESLMVWRSPTTEKFFAAGGGHIYDITTFGTTTSVASGLISTQFQYINFTPSGGTTVIQACNGSDALLQYNGTSWTNPAVTGLPNGGSTAQIINIFAQKKRLWYILKDSTIAAFMPTDAITGPIAGMLQLGNNWVRGGYLVAMAAWTVDGGNGPQDYAVFISSQGECSVYSGVDPTDSTTWTLVGTFTISPPVGRKCFLQVGSDVAIITHQGVLPLSQALPFDPGADRSVSITQRIQNAMAQSILYGQDFYGWQLISYPQETLAILNVPTSAVTAVQYVMNTLTGAWCRFTGWNALCFDIYNDQLYFGDSGGFVNSALTSGTDGTNSILYDMQCAFNWFDDPGRQKRITMIQPLMTAVDAITPTLGIDTDFSTSTQQAPLSNFTGTGALWDVAVWDNSFWSGQLQSLNSWYSVQAIGHALAIRMSIQNNVTTSTVGEFDIALFDAGRFDQAATPAPVLQVNAFNAILELGGFI